MERVERVGVGMGQLRGECYGRTRPQGPKAFRVSCFVLFCSWGLGGKDKSWGKARGRLRGNTGEYYDGVLGGEYWGNTGDY